MHTFKTVDEFLNALDKERRPQVLKLREYILETEPSLIEHIKWNAPSYVKDSEDRITFNTMNKEQAVKLVFHMGATRKENKQGQPILNSADLIDWASDIRGYATFKSIDDVISHEKAIKQHVHDWLLLN